jgi:hypothetical protein
LAVDLAIVRDPRLAPADQGNDGLDVLFRGQAAPRTVGTADLGVAAATQLRAPDDRDQLFRLIATRRSD